MMMGFGETVTTKCEPNLFGKLSFDVFHFLHEFVLSLAVALGFFLNDV
jgi:hypothetical protein